jgi:soluble lytic murein transglycosylase-like protein
MCAAALLLAASLDARAAAAVVFTDGRTLRVDRVERDAETVRLFLEGGGALALPAARIARWRDLSGPDEFASTTERPAVDQRFETDPAWRQAAGDYAELIGRTAARHAVDPALLTAMAQIESAFDPFAVSPKGASGLLQLMPETADRFGVGDVFDASENVDGAARYLSWLLRRYDGRTDLALAGFNAGEGAVDRHSGIPPYRETQRYVRQVLEGAARLADLAP